MKKYLLEVVKIKVETEDTKTFVFESYNDKGQKEKIDFQAGQYLDLFFPEDKDGHGKPYTISSAPSENLQITVKKIGKFSGKLHELEIGGKIYASGPNGFMTMQETDHPDYKTVFIAGGVGITLFSQW